MGILIKSPSKTLATSFYTSDNEEIHYQIHRQSDASKCIVFLHGLGGCLAAWDKVVAEFQQLGYTTIAVDLRGHGYSSRPKKASCYTLERYANDIVELLAVEQIAKTDLVGHCFGAMIASTFSSLYTHRVGKLALLAVGDKAPKFYQRWVGNTLTKKLVQWASVCLPRLHIKRRKRYARYQDTQDFHVRRILSDLFHTSLKSYVLASLNIVQYDISKLSSNMTIPVLVVAGMQDSVYPQSSTAQLARQLPGSKLMSIEKGNHILLLNNVAQTTETVKKFINQKT